MKITVWMLTSIALLWCSTAQAQTCQSLDELNWLVGEWKAETETALITETWEQTSTLNFEGRGLQVSKSDASISRELLRLLSMNNQIFYLAKVDENSLPIPFQLVRCVDNHLIFLNPQHDFPKRIEYQLLEEDSLKVTVGDGGSRYFELDFIKQ